MATATQRPARAELFLAKVLHRALERGVSPFSGPGGSIARIIVEDVVENGVELDQGDIYTLVLDAAKCRGLDKYYCGQYRGVSRGCPGPVECLAHFELRQMFGSAIPDEVLMDLIQWQEKPSCQEYCSENADPELQPRVEEYIPVGGIYADGCDEFSPSTCGRVR